MCVCVALVRRNCQELQDVFHILANPRVTGRTTGMALPSPGGGNDPALAATVVGDEGLYWRGAVASAAIWLPAPVNGTPAVSVGPP